ncbi:MAG: shikimate dehydrogenase [Candidatus Omnitrophica bacterium]|nr:shikimate dehydrogenase [Candidatus Omnitrophota bacterium]
MTRIFGVIGHPVAHSLSPAMHEAAFHALRLDAVYAAIDAPPKHLRPMLQALALAGVEGLNVTVPLKEAIAPWLDRLDPHAAAMRAVNTVVISNRRTIGYNTDGIGFRRALIALGWRPRATRAVILGAGGAAQAVAWELARIRGSRLTIANRHLGRARRLARWLTKHHPGVCACPTRLSRVRLDDADLLVNATSVGMRPSDGLLIDPCQLRQGLMVYDLVYNRTTPLVAAARRRRCVAANGASMLLYQGAESFRLWWHRPPPLAAMRRALQEALTR